MRSIFEPFERNEAYNNLRDQLASAHPPLALVGSGASLNSAYPSWTALMEELEAEAGPKAQIPKRKEALKGDPAWEAEVHARAIGAKRFSQYMKDRFSPNGSPVEPHPTIASLPFKHFLTTNYDPCIELCLRSRGEQANVVRWEDAVALSAFLIGLSRSDTPRSVVYLHGRYDVPQHAVLTESSYVDRYIKSDDARRKLLAIFMTHPVVFIGFSMSDPDFANLMREVTARLKTTPPCHYAILGYGSEEEREVYRERMRGKFGIEPIFYSYARDEGDPYAHLVHLLQALSPMPSKSTPSPMSAAERSRDIDPGDPNKGQFGGKAEANGRRLRVVRRPGGINRQTLMLDLIVDQTDAKALEGDVTFYLHPTFAEPVQLVRANNGRATLKDCHAYGAFTVGISADRGKTKLELDLATDEKLPEWFRRR
ncbi:SIR2 family protein [Rhizobium sp. WYJ-E13]|uniref:SIR2 family NAD-dependent protein deacylase n=1 Tax=Rhizobium sp. WYJ-E13 TaxID=2849093 RepID=UPI001C1EDC5F|nr:SIR2 family protein [Rhizobium sp. WYJ-E13]QWW71371.1 SIR2 family protein [Rhizobium sp. WYJ-E13]